MASNTAIYLYVGVSIIIMCVLAGFLIKCNNKSCSSYAPIFKDKCTCSKGGMKLCSNREESKASYEKGNTEYQNFSEIQKCQGGPYWSNTDKSVNCFYPDKNDINF